VAKASDKPTPSYLICDTAPDFIAQEAFGTIEIVNEKY
jgi:hypothetical protein